DTHSSVVDFAVAMENLHSADDVWSSFLKFSSGFGLPHGALVDLPGPGEQLIDTAWYLSCPLEWRKRYFERNYFPNDPAALHLQRSSDPYTWSDILACPDYTPSQRRIVHEASVFGMHQALVVPLVALGTRAALIELAGSNKNLGTRDKAELQLA